MNYQFKNGGIRKALRVGKTKINITNLKTINRLIFIGAVALLISCASTAKFPVSSTVPAAEIVAKKKQDKNNNYVIELTTTNLADPTRLQPPKSTYIVWIVDENGNTKNIGKLFIKNSKKAILKTSTPFNVKEIILTAEDEGNLSYPSGIEISRTTFSK